MSLTATALIAGGTALSLNIGTFIIGTFTVKTADRHGWFNIKFKPSRKKYLPQKRGWL